MIDLKNPKWEDFDVVEMPNHGQESGQKVRCTFYRAVQEACVSDATKYQVTDIPKDWYNEFFQERV